MLSERTIINGLLLLGGMILGPYLIILTLGANPYAILAFGGFVFFFWIFLFVRDRISIFPVIASYFSGTLNFLPLGLTPVEVASLTAILYYLVNYVALKRRPFILGSPYFLFPMLVTGAIVAYHNQAMGLRVLGSGNEGSRPGLLILVSIVTYFFCINIPSPSAIFLNRVPLYCCGLALLGSIPFLLTTYFPSLAPSLYYISGNVNLTAYIQSVSGTEGGDVSRNGALAGIGSTLASVFICYFPITTWWHPKRWILIILFSLCFYCVLLSGFRNLFLGFLMFTVLATFCYTRWRILFLLPLLAILPLTIIVVQNDHLAGIVLPDSVQRSMSFLPGNWDKSVIESADASNDFRHNIARLYKSEYMAKSPWIGNGFTFNPSEPDGLAAMATTRGVSDPEYYVTKAFLVSKNFHIGWISLYDAVGIIGGIAFVLLNITMVWTSICFIFKKGALGAPLFPLKVWVFCNLTSGLIGFFTTFGSYSQSFIGMCGFCILLFHIDRLEQQDTFVISPSTHIPPVPPGPTRTFSPAGA